MAKQTTEQTLGLCREAITNIRNAYDRGYKQGYKDGEDIEQKNGAVTKAEVAKMEYKRGLNDAWETAKKIALASSTDEEMNKIFGDDFYYMSLSAFFNKYSVDEVMSKIKKYSVDKVMLKIKEYEEKQKQKQKPIEVEFATGDEVISDARRFVVLGIDNGEWYQLWCLDNGLTYDNICSKDLTKTGRSFPQLVDLFKQMKGE
jgi:hypothetical protein